MSLSVIFYFVSKVHLAVLLPNTIFIIIALNYVFISGRVTPPSLLFLCKLNLDIHGLLFSYILE